MRKKTVAYSLIGHTDTITSLQTSPDSQSLLSNSHDSTVRTWDIRPFAPADRQIRTYDGAPTGMEKNLLRASWDPTGKKIAAGSGDRTMVVWDTATGKLLSKLPGHKGAVNDVRFHPGDEPISKSSHISFHAHRFLKTTPPNAGSLENVAPSIQQRILKSARLWSRFLQSTKTTKSHILKCLAKFRHTCPVTST